MIRDFGFYGLFILGDSYDKPRGLKTYTWFLSSNETQTIILRFELATYYANNHQWGYVVNNHQATNYRGRYKPKETTGATWPLSTHPFTEEKYSGNGKSIEGIYEGGYQSYRQRHGKLDREEIVFRHSSGSLQETEY